MSISTSRKLTLVLENLLQALEQNVRCQMVSR